MFFDAGSDAFIGTIRCTSGHGGLYFAIMHDSSMCVLELAVKERSMNPGLCGWPNCIHFLFMLKRTA